MDVEVIGSAVQGAAALETVLQPSFGPNGLDILLEGADGHAACIGNGMQLLNSLRLSHPAGLLIFRAVKDYHKVSGDGSKKMVLILAAALREIHRHCAATQSEYRRTATAVSRAFHLLEVMLTEDILPQLSSWNAVCVTTRQSEDINRFCPKLLDSCCVNHYSYSVRRKLREMLMSLLFPRNSQDLSHLRKQVEFCRDSLGVLTTHFPGVAITESQVLPGFLIDGDFVSPPNNVSELQSFKCLLLMTGLGWEQNSSIPATISVSSQEELRGTVDFFSRYVKKIIFHLHSAGVKLVLCGGKVWPAAVQVLREFQMLAVEMVPEDTLLAIAEYNKTHPIPNTITLIESLNHSSASLLEVSCKYVTVGGKKFLHLICAPHSADPHPYSLLLCAPTMGLYRQLAQTVRNSIQLVSSWLQKCEGGVRVVAGGGAWEIAVFRELQRYMAASNSTRGSAEWIAIAALQKGLLAIPHTLYTSSLPQTAARSLTRDFHHKVLPVDQALVGVDCVHGCLKTVDSSWQIWEPYWTQHLLLHSVLVLLSQLLRIDRIIPVPRLMWHSRRTDED